MEDNYVRLENERKESFEEKLEVIESKVSKMVEKISTLENQIKTLSDENIRLREALDKCESTRKKVTDRINILLDKLAKIG